MPLYERQLDHRDPFTSADLIEIEDRPDPTTKEVATAIWEVSPTNNAIEWMQDATNVHLGTDPNFNPDWKTLDPRYRPIFRDLVDAESQTDFDNMRQRFDKSQAHFQTIADSGLGGTLAYVGASVLDPITLPLFALGFAKIAQTGNIAQRMGKVAGIAMSDIGLRETLEHYGDPGREADTTYKSLFLAGAVGSAGGAIAGPFMRGANQAKLRETIEEVRTQAERTYQSAGAAAAQPAKATVAMEKPLKGAGVVKKFMLRTPILRMAYSTDHGLAAPAKFVAELIDTGIFKAKHLAGIAEDFNISIGKLVGGMRNVSTAELNGALKAVSKSLKSQGIRKNVTELDNHLEMAVVGGDDVLKYPEMLDLVREIRKSREALFDRAFNVGIFNKAEHALYNKHYGPRFWDHKKLSDQPTVFEAAVVRGYRAGGDTRTIDELQQRARDSFLMAKSLGRQGQADIGNGFGMGPLSSHAKGITMKVQDEYIEGFLIRSARKSQDSLIRQLETEVLLRERYGRGALAKGVNGRLTIKPMQDEMIAEFKQVRDKLLDKGDTKGADTLKKVHDKNLLDLEHLTKKLTGYGEFDGVIDANIAQYLNELKAYASSAWMGNSVIASLQEPMKQAMEQGFGRFFKSVGTVTLPKKLTLAEKQHLKAVAVGNEMNSYGATSLVRADIDDPGVTTGARSFATRKLAPLMYRYNGQDTFNTIFKRSAAVGHQDQVLRFALGTQSEVAGSAEHAMTIARFAQVGISKSMLRRIGAAAKQDGGMRDIDGVLFGNTMEWTDTVAADTLNESLMQIADATIIHPGMGAVPRILDNAVGSLLVQFKRILFGMQGQMLIPTAQRLAHGDMRAARGLAAYMGVAWAQVHLRMMLAHNFDMDEYQKEFDRMSAGDHIRDMMDRGGFFPFFMQGLGIADVFTEGGLSNSIGLNESARTYYRNASTLGNVMPAYSILEKNAKALFSPLMEDGYNQSVANSQLYTMPLRTVFYADPILDVMQQALVSRLPEKERRSRKYSKQEIDLQ